jgi:mannitol-1-phosphate/altronate dehydrogenase
MGQLFREAGLETVFVDANASLVERLNQQGRYLLRILDAYAGQACEMTIDRFKALSTTQDQEIAEAVAAARIVATAVGVANLDGISLLLAGGIRRRFERKAGPLDVYLCENMLGAAALRYDCSEDPAAIRLQIMIQRTGLSETLRQVSGVEPSGDFAREVIRRYRDLESLSP